MTDRQYGGFWRRFFAFWIDGIILYFVSLILLLISLLVVGLQGEAVERMVASLEDPANAPGLFALFFTALSLLAGLAYFTLFHGLAGRTPGKMLLGLCVIQASGDPLTPGLAFLRWVGYLVSGLLFGLGFLWVAFDCRKQGWHDKIAATLVIRRRGAPLPAPEATSVPAVAALIPEPATPDDGRAPAAENRAAGPAAGDPVPGP